MKTTTTLSTEKQEIRQLSESKWDIAIKVAKEEIESLANKQKQLEQSVKIFRMNKRDGVPWPGEGER